MILLQKFPNTVCILKCSKSLHKYPVDVCYVLGAIVL